MTEEEIVETEQRLNEKFKELKKGIKEIRKYNDYMATGYGRCPNENLIDKTKDEIDRILDPNSFTTNKDFASKQNLVNDTDMIWYKAIKVSYDEKLAMEVKDFVEKSRRLK